MTRDEEIVNAAKEHEKCCEFGDLVQSSKSRGVNSAYGIGFLEGAVWADKHPKKGLVDINDACNWLGAHFYDSKYEFRDDDGAWIDVHLVLEDLKKAMNKPIYE